jgi:Amt family ammonium transporter
VMTVDGGMFGWSLVCSGLVFLMQAGQASVEVARTRGKNNADVIATGFARFLVATLAFWAIGYALMAGQNWRGFAGTSGFLHDGAAGGGDGGFLFHTMLAGVVVAVASGATAERMRYVPGLIGAAVVAGLVYPVVGHWMRGGGTDDAGWLAEMGFIEFAGATSVHSVGGWCALATLILTGARRDRFDARRMPVQANGIPFAMLGTLLILLGGFGLTAGSAGSDGVLAARAVVNMLLAAASGGFAVLVLTVRVPRLAGLFDLFGGSVAGLVAISASAAVATPATAAALGAVGGLVALFGRHLLESFRIDDAIGAVPVHLFAGMWGTIAAAFVTPPHLLPAGHSLYGQFLVQTLGIALVGIWAFGVPFIAMAAVRHFIGLRVDADAERRGLNLAQHGIVTDMAILTGRLGLYRKTADLTDLFDGSDSDLGDIARDFNRAVDRFRGELTRARRRIGPEGATGGAPGRMLSIEREEDELRVATEEVNMVTDQLAQAAPLVIGAVAPKDRFVRALQATFEAPIRDFADLERRIRTERDERVLGEMIETARERSAGLARKLAAFVDFADAATADEPPRSVDFGLREMVADVIQDFAERASVGGVLLVRSVDDDAARICAHPGSIRKILRRLVDNAIRFNQQGGLVEVTATRDGDTLRIVVADTGCGMTPTHVARILDPFRAEIDPAGGPEPGVGLALIARLAMLHGGRFTIDSKPGIGTKACLEFPARIGTANRAA